MYRKAFVVTFKVILICILAVIVLGASAAFGLARGIIDSAPDISQVDVSPSGYSTNIYDSDGNVITSRGMGTALPFALKLLALFAGEEAAQQMKETIVFLPFQNCVSM